MKKILALIMPITLLFCFSGCGKTQEPVVEAPEQNFYFDDTKWGMSIDEIIALKGEPDKRNDQGDAVVPEGETPLVDFYYNDQPILEKYTGVHQYLFDKDNMLEGVIASTVPGKIDEDGANLPEVVETGKNIYRDIRALFSQQYGEPAAEYTAYRDGETYKTDEELDLDKEDALICASRWDGDNYRFLYIVYFLNENLVELRYIPHDKETVDNAEAEKDAAAQ